MTKRVKINIWILSLSGMLLAYVAIELYKSFPEHTKHEWAIEQTVTTNCCARGESSLATFVWHDDEIIAAYYDPLATLNDSTKIKRRMQAQTLIDNLKK